MSPTPVTVTNTEYTITDDEIPPSFKQGMVEIDLIARAEKAETQLAVLEADFEKLALSAAQAADRNVELRCRAEKAEAELAAANVEIENLIWNLAGCSTIAGSGKPTDYSHELARPALHDVNKLAARAEKAEAECLEQARLLGMSREREADLLGKISRLHSIIERASVQFFHEGTDGETAVKMLTILTKAKHELNAGVNKQDL